MNPIRASIAVVAAAIAPAVLCGCVGLTGLSGTSQYGCKAPEGVKCESVSGTYYNSLANNLPSQRQGGRTTPRNQAAPARMEALGAQPVPVRAALAAPDAAAAPMPLRSQAWVLRLWVKPWEDAEGDLVDQMYVYVAVDNGRWLVDRVQRQIRDAYAPVKAPPAAPEPTSEQQAETPRADRAAPGATTLAQRLQAARGLPAAQANGNGGDDAQ
jgi:conjugal transfer pilus assembly protein TraV